MADVKTGTVTVSVEGTEVATALKQLASQTADLSPAMRAISEALQFETSQNFAAEGRPGWTPLAKSTIKQRQKTGTWPGKKLQVKGRLAASISSDYSPVMAAIGSNLIYAGIHQFGGAIQHAARSQQQYRHHNEKTGELGNRFVKKSKANFASWATIGAHTVNIPARPFLPVTADGRLQPAAEGAVVEAILQHLAR